MKHSTPWVSCVWPGACRDCCPGGVPHLPDRRDLFQRRRHRAIPGHARVPGHEWRKISGREMATLNATQAGTTRSFTFPANLPGGMCTAISCTGGSNGFRKRVLIGDARICSARPHHTRLRGSERLFFPIGGATVNYADVDQITYCRAPNGRRQCIEPRRQHGAERRDQFRRTNHVHRGNRCQ